MAVTYTNVTGTTQTMVVDNGYITNNTSLVTLTLPTTAAFGKFLIIIGYGSGGWKIAQNASQVIHYGNVDTTTGTGGNLSSVNRYDCIEIVNVVANTDWVVRSSQGNINYL